MWGDVQRLKPWDIAPEARRGVGEALKRLAAELRGRVEENPHDPIRNREEFLRVEAKRHARWDFADELESYGREVEGWSGIGTAVRSAVG